MAELTGISWADSTANFWIGCQKTGSRACQHCYAETMFGGLGEEKQPGEGRRLRRVVWGPHGDRSHCKQGWSDCRKWQRAAAANGGVDPALGRKRRVFVNSLSDFFDNHRSIVWRDEAWALIRACPDLVFLLLTKRAQNIAKMLPDDWGNGWPNVWIGSTVIDQAEADRDVPHLLAVPAALRFLSMEPLLGPVDLTGVSDASTALDPECWGDCDCDSLYGYDAGCRRNGGDGSLTHKIGWVIVGGESGKDARPSNPDWVRGLRDQCARAGVPFHFKQWGEWGPVSGCDPGDVLMMTGEGPVKQGAFVRRVGKHAAGRLLDGVEHLEFPPCL